MKRALLVALSVVLLSIIRVHACAATDDTVARYAYVAERIHRHQLPGLAPGHPFDGEWAVVTISSASMAALQLATTNPSQRSDYARDASDFARLLASPELRAYDTKQWGADAFDSREGHAGYMGHLVLTMDVACLLGGERDEALHAQLADLLARRVGAGLLETYPGETYVPDNVVVLAALAQYDACTGTPTHRPLITAWLSAAKRDWLDEENGLLTFAPGQRARGSGAAWNALYLPLVDEPFAAEQSEKLWTTFGDTAAGGWLGGIREWPRGTEGGEDVDSGPLVFGISPSATGYALSDAVLRDRPERDALLRTAELTGVTIGGRYLFSPLVGDAITLAARTATRWPTKPMSSNQVSITLLAPSGRHDQSPRTASGAVTR